MLQEQKSVGWSPDWFPNSHLCIGRQAAINHQLLHILGMLLWAGLETFLNADGRGGGLGKKKQ